MPAPLRWETCNSWWATGARGADGNAAAIAASGLLGSLMAVQCAAAHAGEIDHRDCKEGENDGPHEEPTT